MIRRTIILLWFAGMLPLFGQMSISWGTGAVNKPNLTSDGRPMDAGFRFELGVFEGAFVPTPANTAEWAAKWHRAGDREPYLSGSSAVAGNYRVPSNQMPFTAGRKAYVWGFRGGPVSGEWILLSAAGWLWPSVVDGAPPAPGFRQWFATEATPVIGEIYSSGSPFLIKSAAVGNASPPATSWDEWQKDNLAGVTLKEPDDDADEDGTANLLEFVFGTTPTLANPPVAMPMSLDSGHLVITIPRRIDHPAILTMEVSGNLVDWVWGTTATETLSDGPAARVVRVLAPLDTANPRRFIRLRAVLP